ncbi:hypothetical protein HBI56_074860 [Parastagonospora nodorum]|uniref:Uncharacterized protein n=1 Tax=Phaeosphaeria nodorum (strain SN15 / ATCC MYA-4574 / FGSC 10173) TaxID=321614 RepID=A0A7U2HXW7_PHANO|nr:hypothetical protein HBH56_170130 [Parastagonospora nodorum]QRC94424.1 hypothetical protein JI435_076660 [Parastagonospora nodorum SN15]KAH3928425.1 hypothetical protein HBH54_138680 [Parastagonospora nodorum]KAH3983700.1 hypothetical protein HBH52_060190 [Parastagonospora nodorum]KAH3985395.1 hypothetical protein HBH51_019020 [Parastagonospora nodorum]
MSSTTNAPEPDRQATMIPKQPRFEDRISQTVYDDGHGRYIVASRQRPQIVRRTDAADNRHSRSRPIRKNEIIEVEERLLSRESPRYPASRKPSNSEGLAPSREVCVEQQSPKYPRKVVVIPALSKPVNPALRVERSTLQRWAEPTPPPTPRSGRLPSPELSDLEEAPFCECDEAIMPKCCASCKNAMHPWGR